MNDNLIAELLAMAAKVDEFEIETKKAIGNMNKEVEMKRSEKEKHIVSFINRMANLFKACGCKHSDNFYVNLFIDDWDGEPGACGSHKRSLALKFDMLTDKLCSTNIGRLFIGSGDVDTIVFVGDKMEQPARGYSSTAKYQSVRAAVIDTPELEERITKTVCALAKHKLKDRSQKCVDNLKAANAEYDKYLKEV